MSELKYSAGSSEMNEDVGSLPELFFPLNSSGFAKACTAPGFQANVCLCAVDLTWFTENCRDPQSVSF